MHDDPRSTEQLTADAFLALTKLGVKADPKRIAGGRNPAVRMVTIRPTGTTPAGTSPTSPTAGSTPAEATSAGTTSTGVAATGTEPSGPAPEPSAAPTTDTSVDAGVGHRAPTPTLQPGVIEGTAVTVSSETMERSLCDSGLLDVTFDDHGHGLDLGREQRTFSPAQRTALAIRDGGCMWPGCDRPPSWTETHHIEHWKDDTGQTNLDHGVLLCRADHLRLHNEHWRITRDDTDRYWLTPPPRLDPDQTPILLTSTSPIRPEEGQP
ncbi:DUF222 domain-containing protein [Cryobacterium algoricola]|uniref:DUF222 domain-containing protein n=1 Tax=Cryobacterium algoricola TaxID=1259183 RepID=A0ABY2ICY2_9MICO|nr:HNH endonuclease signature motif containing protein [Cryobacterium algoricola]TFB87333.1 DUF222 domain-containing protein [Cryobacterium algoricola]